MSQYLEKHFWKLDGIEQRVNASKLDILDLAEEKQVKLSIEVKDLNGLFFSYVNGQVIARGVGKYSGHLLLSRKSTSELAFVGNLNVRCAKVEEVSKAIIYEHQQAPYNCPLFDQWQIKPELSELEENGFYPNALLGADVDEAIKISILQTSKSDLLPETPGNYNPFNDAHVLCNEVYAQGKNVTLRQARINNSELSKIGCEFKEDRRSDLDPVSIDLLPTEIERVIARVIKKRDNPTFLMCWRYLKNDVNSEERMFDIRHIIVDMTDEDICYISDYENRTSVLFGSFRNTYSKVRKRLGKASKARKS